MTPSPNSGPPVLLVLLANDRFGSGQGTLDLSAERTVIERAFTVARHDGRVELVVETELTIDRYSDHLTALGPRIVGVHFAGHANASAVIVETSTGAAEGLGVEGFARTLAELPNLRWLFLNGCNTQPQVAGVQRLCPVPMIATRGAILDTVAIEFADHFHRALGRGRPVASAFRHAEGMVRSRMSGGDRGGLVRMLRPAGGRDDTLWPWALTVPEQFAGCPEFSFAPPAASGHDGGPQPAPDGARLRLERAEAPAPPSTPYPPVLGFYTDRRTFAGREHALIELRQILDRTPVVCVYARSGAGKSSLIAAGLVPALRDDRIPTAVVRTPHEASAPQQLLEGIIDPPPEQSDLSRFVDAVRMAHSLAGRPPVLVLDQFEEAFKGASAPAARARLGRCLAATMRPGPVLDDRVERPLCHWVLAYRHEFHGDVRSWLRDVLTEARAAGVDTRGLAHDLTAEGRSAEWPLPIFGAPAPGESAEAAARKAFSAAIIRPLAVVEPPWSISTSDAARLADAFAKARLADAEAPLVSELQVVLARLVRRADQGGHRRLEVAAEDDLDAEIGDALEAHVLWSIERILPLGQPGVRRRRALLLAALARLVDDDGQRSRRLPPSALSTVIGADGGDGRLLLDALTGAGVRLLTVQVDDEHGPRFSLAHDRLARVVGDLMQRAPHGIFDPATLDLVDFVQMRISLHQCGDPAALARDDARFKQLTAAPELCIEPARATWWAAWRTETKRAWAAEQTRARYRRWTRVGLIAALVVAAGFASVAWQQHRLRSIQEQNNALALEVERQRHRIAAVREGYRAALASADRAMVLNALAQLVASGSAPEEAIADLPASPAADIWSLMAETFIDISPDQDAQLRLAWARAWADPHRIEAGAPSTIAKVERVGRLLAAVHNARAGGRPTAVHDARRTVVRALHACFPPPKVSNHMLVGRLLPIAEGAFALLAPSRDRDRRPRESAYRARLSPFAIGVHEVTTAQFRRLVPDHRPEDDGRLPARFISWYAAMTFAAWVGARLPTEAEWEFAVRNRGRRVTFYCTGNSASALDDIAHVGRFGAYRPASVGEKAPCSGLHDMHGNVEEWVADWYGPYPSAELADPLGPVTGDKRVVRGGALDQDPLLARTNVRGRQHPTSRSGLRGFRLAQDVQE